jgi:hypothetical protein
MSNATTEAIILHPTTCEPMTVTVDKSGKTLWRVYFPNDLYKPEGWIFAAKDVRRWQRVAKAKIERDAK